MQSHMQRQSSDMFASRWPCFGWCSVSKDILHATMMYIIVIAIIIYVAKMHGKVMQALPGL